MLQTRAKIIKDGEVIDGACFGNELDDEEKRRMKLHFEELHGSDIEVEFTNHEQRCPDTKEMFGG